MSLQRLLTDLGDLAVAGSVAVVLAAWIGIFLSRIAAAAFAICVVMAVAVSALLKMAAAEWLAPPDDSGLLVLSAGAPSGHAVLAVLIYGVAALIFLRCGAGLARGLGVAVCLAVIGVVLATRVTLHAHTIADTAAGAFLAFGPLGLMRLVIERQVEPAGQAGLSLLAGLSVIALTILALGLRMPSTRFL